MAYSKAKKSNGDKASPCFKPFLIETCQVNVSLPGLCYELHSDTFSLALPNSGRIRWKTSLLTESQAFLKYFGGEYNSFLHISRTRS